MAESPSSPVVAAAEARLVAAYLLPKAPVTDYHAVPSLVCESSLSLSLQDYLKEILQLQMISNVFRIIKATDDASEKKKDFFRRNRMGRVPEGST